MLTVNIQPANVIFHPWPSPKVQNVSCRGLRVDLDDLPFSFVAIFDPT